MDLSHLLWLHFKTAHIFKCSFTHFLYLTLLLSMLGWASGWGHVWLDCNVTFQFWPGILTACHPLPTLWWKVQKHHLDKKLHSHLSSTCISQAGQRDDWLSVHLGVSNFLRLPFQKLFPSWSATIQTMCPPSAVVPSALHPEQKDPLSVSGCLLALWSSMNSANCLRSGKFLCHRGTLISKSQMELHRGCIIYVKLLFLPGNPRICPHLLGP